jgi:DNA-binding response OmpR family regulator
MTKILIVEDDSNISQLYSMELVRNGYDVDLATDGAKALDLLASKPALVILDILMPNMDGIEFMRQATRVNGGKTPRIIVMSNVDTPELQKAAKTMGAEQYYLKVNVTPSQLVVIVAEHLE